MSRTVRSAYKLLTPNLTTHKGCRWVVGNWRPEDLRRMAGAEVGRPFGKGRYQPKAKQEAL